MISIYQTLNVFVSSPSDVKTERRMAEEVLQNIHSTCEEVFGIALKTIAWERLPPLTPNIPEERIQDIIDEHLKKSHVFILILYKRYGSFEPGHTKSNTEREVESALELLQREKKLMFLSYFRKIPLNDDRGEQEKAVRNLRMNLEKKGIWYKEYDTPEQFKDLLTHDLYKTIFKFRLSTSKHKAIQSFIQLGVPERPTAPRLAIFYPPIDRRYMKGETHDTFWFERLMPNVVFEDMKALQKLEKVLRLIGFHDFRIYNNRSIPSDVQYMNRIWLCLPRNHRALKQLELYANVSRFRFTVRQPQREAKILWRYSPKSETFFEISSPLSKYLREQRQGIETYDWSAQMGRIIAKDYAILSRFSYRLPAVTMLDGTLKDYFIAGIRGLGTWGAGWFIDRRYNELVKYEEGEDIQLLIEVTYGDERILDVRDVSKEPEKYFEQQNNVREIKSIIEEYKES